MVRSSQDDGIIETNCVITVISQRPSDVHILWRFRRRIFMRCIFMRLPFIREISPQIEKEINSFCTKLDFETKFLLINGTCSLKHVFKHTEQQQILHHYGIVYEISCNCGSRPTYIGQT